MIEKEKVNEQVLERTVKRARERNIIIPTYEEMRDPSKIPDKIKEELKSIILKTIALGERIKELIKKTKNIKYAFIYGSVAKGEEDIKSDIDLMVIGNIDEIKLQEKIQQIESKISRTINYTLMNIEEFKKRLNEKEPFLMRILEDKKIEIIGSENEIR